VTHWSERVLADARDRDSWIAAREGRVGASDAATFSKAASVNLYTKAKLMPVYIAGANSPLNWGHEREPVILADHGYEQNTLMIHAEDEPRFEATPDGIRGNRLAQVKTTIKDFKTVPLRYLRQVWWEQYVLGPEFTETDFIWEKYDRLPDGTFAPEFESHVVVVQRNDDAIASMVAIAYAVTRQLDKAVF
jgi:hypothetical protein